MTPHEFVERLCNLLGPGYGIYNARMSKLITSGGSGEIFNCSVLHKGGTWDIDILAPLNEAKAIEAAKTTRRAFGYSVPSDQVFYSSVS